MLHFSDSTNSVSCWQTWEELWSRFFLLLLTDKTIKMLFVGAKRVVNVAESRVTARQHLDSPGLKHNYKQMFLDSRCQLQSWGTVKVSVPTGVGNYIAFVLYSFFCSNLLTLWFLPFIVRELGSWFSAQLMYHIASWTAYKLRHIVSKDEGFLPSV